MRTSFGLILFLFLSLTVFSQASLSPDRKFGYNRSFLDQGDHIHWKGSLVSVSTNDTLLIIHNYTHDHPAPIAHWSGSKLVFHEGDTIKVYDLNLQKVVYSKPGMIWNHTENFFDQENDIFFFIRYSALNPSKFDLLMLNIKELKEKLLRSFITSGDPITGIPSIVIADVKKRELLVEIKTKDLGFEKMKIPY